MTLVQVEVEGLSAGVALFDRKARFAGDFMKITGRDQLRVVKEDIADEISGQYSLADGRRRWPPTVPIGRLAGGRPALRHFGPARAGAPPQVSAAEAKIQITEQGAGAHVGGRGTRRSFTITAIRGGTATQSAIRAKTGGFVSLSTLRGPGLQLPGRPHANPDNPTTAGKIERRVLVRRFEEA